MIATAPPKPMTAKELERLPDDGYKYELVRGELVKMPPPGEEHGTRASYLSHLLLTVVLPNNLGRVMVETGYYLTRNPDTVRSPDVSFVRRERYAGVAPSSSYREGAPDLAIEIVSPGDTHSQVTEKVQDYLTYGTRLVWLIEPKTQTVTVYRANGTLQILKSLAGESLNGEDVIPGLSIPLNELFKNL